METVRTGVNLELATTPDMVAIGVELQPMAVTLVPERREEITTEGGLDLEEPSARRRVETAVRLLHDAGVRCSLFIAPDPPALDAAAAVGADAVELHTGAWAGCWQGSHRRSAAGADAELARLSRAAARGRSLALAVHAGHGLTYENVSPVAAVGEIEELNIGHSVISRAVLVGLERAVADMKMTVLRARERASSY